MASAWLPAVELRTPVRTGESGETVGVPTSDAEVELVAELPSAEPSLRTPRCGGVVGCGRRKEETSFLFVRVLVRPLALLPVVVVEEAAS